MNAVSMILRLIAIVGALAAGGLYYMGVQQNMATTASADQKTKAAQTLVDAANKERDAAKAEADAADKERDTAKASAAKDIEVARAQRQMTNDAVRDRDKAQDAADAMTADMTKLQTALDSSNSTVTNLNKQLAEILAKGQLVVTQPSPTSGNGTVGTGNGGLVTPVLKPMPTETVDVKITAMGIKSDKLTLGAGSSDVFFKGAVLSVTKDGNEIGKFYVSDPRDDFTIVNVMNGTKTSELAVGTPVTVMRVK